MFRIAVLASALVLTSAAGARALPDPGDDWLQVETPGFVLTSNAKEAKTRELAEAFAGFQAALRLVQPGLRHETPVPVRIFAFRTEKDYAPYRAVLGGDPEGVAGHFFGHTWIYFIFLEAYPGRHDALPIVYHEYVHAHLANNFGRLPLWLNEGLADYFSTLERRKGEIVVGTPPEGRLESVRATTFLPMAQLFAVTEDSPEYNERERRGLYYAQSWLVVHYLLTDPDRGRAAGAFFRRVSEGEDADAALRATMGFGLDDLQSHLRAYANSRTMPILRIPVAALGETPDLEVEPIPDAVALYRLGTYLAFAERPEAVEHLRAATGGAPDAWATLGMLAGRGAVPGDPASLFARAFEGGAGEALSFFLHARWILEGSGEIDADRIETARASLRRALGLDPSFAEARALLGGSYLRGPEPAAEAAATHLERALEALPGRADIAYNLALAKRALGDTETVMRLLDRVIAPADPELANRLRGELARSRIVERVNESLVGGSLDEAEAALEEALAEATDPRLKSELEDRLREVRGQRRLGDLVDRYNQAVALANVGRLQDARKELLAIREALAALGQEPGLMLQAASLAAEVGRTLREIGERSG